MLQQENAEWHDAGQLMKFAQDESPAQMNRQGRAPLPSGLSEKAVGPNWGEFCLRFSRARKLYGEVAENQNASILNCQLAALPSDGGAEDLYGCGSKSQLNH
jgi:hypothetical protein